MMEGRQQAITGAMTGAGAGERREAYNNLSNLFAENGNALDWNEHIFAAETRQVLQNLKVDLTSHKDEEVHEAAGLCVHLLASPSFLAHVGAAEQKDLCDILVTTLKTNKSRKITDIVLQSLAKSRLKREAYLGDLQDTFKILREILQMKDLSASVVCEALQVVLILLNAEPGAAVRLGTSWFPSTFSKMFHANLKVRNSALEVTAKVRETMEEMATPGVRSDLITMVMADLKDKYCKDMARMVLGGSYTILQVWREVVSLLGTELHSMRSLTNLLLNVVEKAFKISEPEVRVESFNTWRVIIDNFALDKNTLTHQKKLQLLLAPLKVSNSRTEEVCSTKLHIWWHLVCLLADQKCLAANFDLAAVPLLQFCFIGGLSSERDKVGRSNRNLIMSGAVSSPHRTFSTLHGAHAEILAQLLTSDTNVPKYKHSSVIHHHLMSPALFMRHYPLLLRCFSETVQTLDFKDVQQNTLGKHIFSSLLGHIRAATVPNVQKKEVVDVVLNSHQYHIPACGSVDAQDIMCGTLSNHLITQLCRPPLLHHALTDSNFVCVWSTVLENSQPVTGKLRFLQAAVQELSASAVPFLCPGDPLVLCDLWNAVLRQMLAHIDQVATTGDCEDSEPDWACVCSVLHFPVIHATEAFSCAPFDIFQHIMETWRLLWHKLTLLTSSTRTVEPNSEVEHVASTLLAFCQDHNTSTRLTSTWPSTS
ncbi:Telomere-associated protein RIF1 [Chionoecetes opilio]|uniref:Telomere-associated protein RIF1 n=1 Tax=Chionoecetes opilio TaxID=41210 RepID=A0A8J4YBS7_CHIOP|nr:Telomere-associated protein RIF1 [Chionoecetes opilio]